MTDFQNTFFSGSGIQAILAFVCGTLVCFFGYRQYKRLFPLCLGYMGLAAGLSLAGRFFHGGIADLLTGLLFMAAFFGLGSFFPLIAMAVFAGASAMNAAMIFTGNIIFCVIVGVLCGIIAYILVKSRKRMGMYAVSGIFGALFMTAGLFGLLGVKDTALFKVMWGLITLVLAGIGMVAQTMMFGKDKAGSKEPAVKAINI